MQRLPAARALPTQILDPDLALIVEIWDHLAVQCKRRLIAIIQEHLPKVQGRLVETRNLRT
jgi:hypothetical protein